MKLLESFRMGSLMLKNRMVMAAMTRSRADIHGVVGTMTAEYYAQRASAGLILSEAINISANALGSPLTPACLKKNRLPPGAKSRRPCMKKAELFSPSSGTLAAWAIPWIAAANCPWRLRPSKSKARSISPRKA